MRKIRGRQRHEWVRVIKTLSSGDRVASAHEPGEGMMDPLHNFPLTLPRASLSGPSLSRRERVCFSSW